MAKNASHQRRQNNPETNSYGIIIAEESGWYLKYGVYHQVQHIEIYYGITVERYVFLEKKKMQ